MKSWQVEVLSVGTWNGDTFTRADLREIAANFTRLRQHLRVPLKFGHADGQTLLGQADGDPALGWVSALDVRGDRLVATFSHVPLLVHQAVETGLYRHVSSEIAYQVTFQGEQIGKVLVGVALLGADLPAVSNLADLGAYLSARGLTPRRVYRFARADVGAGLQGRAMTRSASHPASSAGPPTSAERLREAPASPAERLREAPASPAERLPEGRANLAESVREAPDGVARLTAELAERQAEVERLRLREAEAQDALRLAAFRSDRQSFQAGLDAWVRQGTLTPQARDKALAAVDAQERTYALTGAAPDGAQSGARSGADAELQFGASLVLELLSAMAKPGPLARESATAAPLGELVRQAAQPVAEALSREADKLAATGRFTLAQAQAHVLAQDPELAARWLAEINHTLPSGGA